MNHKMKSKRKSPAPGNRSPAGQSLLEFAITLPVLLMILLGVLDLGRIYFSYIAVVNSAREGARYGAQYPWDTNGILLHSQREPDSLVTVTTAMSPVCVYDALGKPLFDPSGTAITVTVQANFQLLTTYILGGGKIPLQASNTWQVYHSCEH